MKLNASSEKDCQFMVEMVNSCMNEANNSPSIPPSRAQHQCLHEKCGQDIFARKPSARSVPISSPVGDRGIHGDHRADNRANQKIMDSIIPR